MKHFIAISITLFLSVAISAQSVREAETHFNEGRYSEAYNTYSLLLKKDRHDALLNYKAARCLIAMKRYEEAEPLLDFAAGRKVKNAWYYLYEVYYNTYQFDKAIDAITTYMQEARLSDGALAVSQALLEKARTAANLYTKVEDVTIVDSIRVLKSRLLDAYHLQSMLGSIFYISNDSLQSVGYTTGRGDKQIVPVRQDSAVNLAVTYKLLDTWGDTLRISSNVNTAFEENYPFELADGITLYFASKGHGSLGGYDIFMTRFSSASNDYTIPLNIGMPFNSPANDYMLVLDDLAGRGWFATDRFQHSDSVMVYCFIPNAERRIVDDTDAEHYRRAAMLLEYNRLDSSETASSATEEDLETPDRTAREMNFLINDGLVYTSITQFRSPEALQRYSELQDLNKRSRTLAILLEGKRREYMVADDEADRASLRIEVLGLESDIVALDAEIRTTIRTIRRLELHALTE